MVNLNITLSELRMVILLNECKCCEDGAFVTLIESTKISNMIWLGVGSVLKREHIDEVDNSVVFEMRNGHGYIRLGDRSDMNCLDTEYKFEVPNCPNCGRRLGGDGVE